MNSKKLVFLYVAQSRGFKEQGFNFSTAERFQVKKEDGSYHLKKIIGGEEMLPEEFWGRNISEINLLIGENGSGKTTLMQIACQWICQLSEKKLPQEEGILVFQEGDSFGYIGFAKGCMMDVSACCEEVEAYTEDDLEKFLRDVDLVYFSNTMTDLNMDHYSILKNYSMPQRMREAVKKGKDTSGDFMADFRRYEFNKRYNLKKSFKDKKTCDDPLNVAFHEKGREDSVYIELEINHLSFEEIGGLFSVHSREIAEGLEDGWKHYFGESDKSPFAIKLLKEVFIGIIVKLIKWEQQNIPAVSQGIAAGILEHNAGDMPGGTNVWEGLNWVGKFMEDLFNGCETEYEKARYKEIYLRIWKENMTYYMTQFINILTDYLKQDGSSDPLKSWNLKCALDDPGKKSIWHIELALENWDDFERFWEAYKNIAYYAENICFDWSTSSGQSNKESLYLTLNDMPSENGNTWLFLDEPDNTFHLEWKRELVKDLVDICRNQNKMVQAWISTHSPILLSDMPGYAVTYLQVTRDEEGNRKKERCDRQIKTFAQNIYVLFNDAFFMKNGVIGKYAGRQMLETLRYLKDIEEKLNDSTAAEFDIQLEKSKIEWCERIVRLVADPYLKKFMQRYLSQYRKMMGLKTEDDSYQFIR